MAHHSPEEGADLGTTGKRDSDLPVREERGDAHRMRRAASLREGGEQFRLAQEALGIVTWVWDVRTDRVQWHGNPAALLGLARGAFSGRFAEYLACLHPEDLEGAKQTYVDCLQGRRPEYRAVERVIWPDGSLHWLETYGRGEYGPDGRARRMMGVIKDVSERKREEAARLKAEGLLAHVFEASPDYIVVARAADGRFVAVNTAFERATGYAAEDVIGRTAEDLRIWAHAGERRRWLAELRRQGGSLQDWPIELRARGGALLSGTMSTSLIDHDGDQLVICIVHDLTEIKGLERHARQSRHKYEALFAHSPNAIAIARRRDGVMLEVNEAWVRSTGHPRAAVVGRSALELGMWKDPGARPALVSRIEAEGAVTNFRTRFACRDGRVMDVILSGATLELDGEPCVVWSWNDVTEHRRNEEKAREAERKFAALFESSPIGLIVTRPRDRQVIEISDIALQILGLERAQALGTPSTGLAAILDTEHFEQLRLRALGGERVQGDLAVVRRDGRQMDLLLSTALVRLEGEPHFVVSFVDVTEQRRAERERVVADARYRRLFESAREGMFITAPDHTVLDVNPAGCEITGYGAGEIVGRSAAMLYGEEDMRRQPFRTDLAVRWRSVERVMTRRDGRRLDVEVAAGPMPDGNLLAIVRDITERKRSETLLMNVARGVSAEMGGAFFRSLVEHLARELGADYAFIGELVGDRDRVRTLAFVGDGSIVENAEYRLAGSPCINAVTQRGTVVYPERVAELFPEDLGLARRGIQAYVGTSLTGAGGAALGVLVVMHREPVQRGAYWASMIEIFAARAAAEIERARAEALVLRTNASLEEVVRERTAQLEEANRELESYNFSISHDLRQPLNAISGFSELLRESDGAGRGSPQEYVREIESNAARMEQMIEALLQLARAGRGALRREVIDVCAMVGAVVRDLPGGMAAVQVGELPGVLADPVLLRQVWSNLVGNALKYSRHSAAPRIEVGGERRGGRVEYFVRDNGVGFDMRHARRLFTAFHRLPSAADYEGTGVGLAIVERIVRRHGGSIAAQAEPGRGATFRFSLPDEVL
jgi:PAS domain S-box-containing protein